MMIHDLITKLESYGDAHVKELCVLIESIEQALAGKKITQTEYVDLMIDVERLRMVIQEAQDLALDQLIHDAIAELVNIAEKVF